MKKLLLSSLFVLGSTLSAMAPKSHLISREVLGLLEALEYTRGKNTTLIQIPVLDQFKESSEKGSTNHSCVYHAVRNGSCVIQAALDSTQEADQLRILYDKDHMYKMLAMDGDWRTYIRNERKTTNFSDNLDIEELEKLLNREKDPANPHAALANKGIEVAYFDYASPHELSKDDFEAFCVGTGLEEIKRKLDAGEDFVSLIVTYIDPHEQKAAVACTSCKSAGTDKETPCCQKIELCEACWNLALKINNVCPACSQADPGTLVTVPVKFNSRRNGHFVSLVLINVNGKRQYILMDSDSSNSFLFQVNKPISKLLNYLEGNNDPTELLPRYTPDFKTLSDGYPLGKERSLLKDNFDSYKRSYNEQPLYQRAPQKNESLSFEKKSFIGGVLTALVLYAAHYYYMQHKERAQGRPEQTPTLH